DAQTTPNPAIHLGRGLSGPTTPQLPAKTDRREAEKLRRRPCAPPPSDRADRRDRSPAHRPAETRADTLSRGSQAVDHHPQSTFLANTPAMDQAAQAPLAAPARP